MSNYLEMFVAQSRIKADPDLIERWEWDARFHGDKNIKNELAKAKRTATSIKNASKQFSRLKPEHDAALTGAVKALNALADELEPLARWAANYKIFCDAERKREDDLSLETIASQRWGNDKSALQFEIDILNELGSREGKSSFANWLHAVGRYQHIAVEEIDPPIQGRGIPAGNRESAARAIRDAQQQHERPHAWNGIKGPCVICGWSDYEGYLTFRKQVFTTSMQALSNARG